MSDRFLLIGDTRIAARACRELTAQGREVRHLLNPSELDLRRELEDPVSGVIVLYHNDTLAIRYVLAVEHVQPGVAIWVALFDRTAAAALRRVVDRLTITSPASVSVPSLVAGVLDREAVAVHGTAPSLVALQRSGDECVTVPFELPAQVRRAGRMGLLRGQFRPHNSASAIMLGGLLGLTAILVLDTLMLIFRLKVPPLDALQEAVAVLSTVGPTPHAEEHPEYQLFAVAAMLAAIILLAVFTAGVVDHLMSGRRIGIYGRRAMPRSGHVIVVGLGQVGLRLCQELRSLGVAVVGVERDVNSPNLSVARGYRIPVYVGDGSARKTLERVSASRSIAVAAVGSNELDNMAVAVTARALAPGVPVVMRAGDHDSIAETASLFRVGSVVDVDALTVAAVSAWCAGEDLDFLAEWRDRVLTVGTDGTVTSRLEPEAGECPHLGHERQ